MADSSSFSSLMDLVDSHLSQTSIRENRSENSAYGIPIPTPHSEQISMSDTQLSFSPGQRLPIPTFGLIKFGEIDSVLSKQVANMLKAKEKNQEEEKQKLERGISNIKLEDKENDYVIDLMSALQAPCGPEPSHVEQALSHSSSLESLFQPTFTDCDIEPEKAKTPEPLLPCKTDMSYILHRKIRKGKCSSFGKVLCSRLRPVAAPYLKEKVDSDIIRFDFATKSPCDLIMEKLRKPTTNHLI